MAYTHYYTQIRYFTKTEWTNVTAATVKILKLAKDLDIHINDESADGKIILNDSESKNETHGTFVISRELKSALAFCKTADRPYDLIVRMILLVCNHYAPGALEITSVEYSIQVP